jgi:glutathione synthase/RimK-type ligase-like ATP-grasp enzyme
LYRTAIIKSLKKKLHKFPRTSEQGQDETLFLQSLKEQMYIKEKSPAEEIQYAAKRISTEKVVIKPVDGQGGVNVRICHTQKLEKI